MTEIEIALQALSAAVQGNSVNLVILVVLAVLVFGAKQGLEWYKIRAARQLTDAAEKKETRQIQHDDQWRIYEEARNELRAVRRQNRKLYGLYRESLTFHLEAQTKYLHAIQQVKNAVPPKEIKCPLPHCRVRSSIEGNLDQAVAEAQSTVNEMFRDWLQRVNEKESDSGEIQ